MTESLDPYRETLRRRERSERDCSERRRDEGRAAAQQVARFLRRTYDVSRVVLFGSVAGDETLGPRSDIDIAVWGLPEEAYYEAIAKVQGVGAPFKVDVIRVEQAPASLREAVEQEGDPL